MKVFLGVGHGGSDSGAVANGFKEKDLNLSIALACQAELIRHGVTVMMERTSDIGLTSNQAVKMCNDFAPDVAVDIHNNAGGGDGAEVFHHHLGGTSKKLAVNILDEIVKVGQNSRGAKIRLNDNGNDYYYFIRDIVAPSVIVECAFVDHKTDIQIIDTEAERKVMGAAIAKGILRTLGIEYKAPEVTAPTTSKYFSDVPANAWYADSVDYCKEHGLMDGVGDGKFNPNEPLTRAQMATVTARLHKMLSEK